MRNWLILLFTLVSTVGTAQTRDEKAVLALSDMKFGWLIRKEADSLGMVLDDRLQYIHSNGWVQTKQEVLSDMRSGKLAYQRIAVKEASVRIYEKTAIVTGMGTFEGVNSGTPFKMDLRYTEVYTYLSGGWKLVSRHDNRMP